MQFACRLQDQYFATMASNLLKVAPLGMTFKQFWAECIGTFGTRSRKVAKTTLSTNIVKKDISKANQLAKSGNQLYREKKGKIKVQTETIEQQKREIKTLKATSM